MKIKTSLQRLSAPVKGLIFWAAVVSLPIAYWLAWSHCESQIHCCEKKNQKEKHPAAKEDPSVLTFPVAYKYQPNDHAEGKSSAEPECHCSRVCSYVTKATEDPVAGFTAILVLVVWLQFLWLFRQEWVLERSVRAASKSADAASDNVITFVAAERAYVFAAVRLDSFDNSIGFGGKKEFGPTHATVFFWNYGKTVAVVTMIRGDIYVLEKAPDSMLDFPGAEKPLPPSLGVEPGDNYNIHLEHNMTLDEFVELKNLSKRMFFVGKMDYRTVLSDNDCTTGFCWELLYQDKGARIVPSRDSKLNRRT